MSENESLEIAEAWGWSLRVLQTATKSCLEMHQRLNRKGYSETVVENVLQQLQTTGYLNDKVFAQSIYRRYTDVKPSGKTKIFFELKKRKIPQDIISSVMSEDIEADELRRAIIVAEKKWKNTVCAESRKRQKRVFDFLLQRGFSFQIARDALSGLEQESFEIESDIE